MHPRAWRSPRPAALALTMLLALAPVPASAQVLIGILFGEKLSSPTFNMGFEIGMNFANLDGMKGAERVNEAVFGLFADWRFSEHFHFGGSFLPVSGHGAQEIKPVATGDPDFDAMTANGKMERDLNFIDFPLLLRWAPQREKGFRIGAGTQFGMRTGATDVYDARSATGKKFTAENDIEETTPWLNVGLAFDVEYRLNFLSIGARYIHGLTDLDESAGGGEVYDRALTGTGRIYLGKSKKKEPEPK